MIFRAPALTARVERASNAEENHWLVINTTTPVSQDNALSENHEQQTSGDVHSESTWYYPLELYLEFANSFPTLAT
ncbi:hypothetical protein HZH66_004046 [Vespula vulgaris]|uniref:Uncharacterized protein n=1 Tax=Vespula vulgaris TaxID=7454 RepID=A0A834NDN5_VESVU|nr:hypothetical protein HZH66_004046 [Vespula vulgaris]